MSKRMKAAVVTTASAVALGVPAASTAAYAKSDNPNKKVSHSKTVKGKKPSASVKGNANLQVARVGTRLTKALDRTVRDNRLRGLSADTAAEVVASVEADKVVLSAAVEAAAEAETRSELRDSARTFRQVRPANYRLSVNVLRQLERAGVDETADLAVQDAYTVAWEAALDLDAFATQGERKDFRRAVVAYRNAVEASELEDDSDDVEDVEDVENDSDDVEDVENDSDDVEDVEDAEDDSDDVEDVEDDADDTDAVDSGDEVPAV